MTVSEIRERLIAEYRLRPYHYSREERELWAAAEQCLESQQTRIDELEAREQRLREALEKSYSTARWHEPNNGWGTRSEINDAWADGFLKACVEVSDELHKLAQRALKEVDGDN